MKKQICLQIPLGYELVNKTEHMKVWRAEKRLLSRRARRYTRAVRQGEDAVLHGQYIVCPHCGERVSVNAAPPSFSGVSREQVSAWADLQLSVFDNENSNELVIAPPTDGPKVFVCPGCESESLASAAVRTVELTLENEEIHVKCEVSKIDEMIASRWLHGKALTLLFPCYETLTLDLGEGNVWVSMEDAQANVSERCEITDCPELLKGGAVYRVLTSNKTVLRAIKKLLEEVWQCPLPYTEKQIDLPALVQMTRFVGYPQNFYPCIPYVPNSHRIDESFAAQAKQLHLAKDAGKLYDASSLPQSKSVRRAMFENPGSLFYINEVSTMWKVLADHNLLCRFLQGYKSFSVLCELHMRPGIVCYFRDYCRVKGAKSLCDGLQKNWSEIRDRAVEYCCMSPQLRRQAQARWQSKRVREEFAQRMPGYSLPMGCPDEKIPDCTIDGYRFFWLRSSNEYAKAAKQLKNCLSEWQPGYSPVVCVKKREKYLAAIEVAQRCVVQARGYHNEPIEDDPLLFEAFKKWIDCYGLQWSSEEDLWEDPDGDMPF